MNIDILCKKLDYSDSKDSLRNALNNLKDD